MDRIIRLGQLLDWYGAFLTQRQSALVRQYAYEDCSLAEIAEREGVSRQAVRDAITRAEKELTQMEQKLRLIDRYEKMHCAIEQLRKLTDDPAVLTQVQRLADILEDNDGV